MLARAARGLEDEEEKPRTAQTVPPVTRSRISITQLSPIIISLQQLFFFLFLNSHSSVHLKLICFVSLCLLLAGSHSFFFFNNLVRVVDIVCNFLINKCHFILKKNISHYSVSHVNNTTNKN